MVICNLFQRQKSTEFRHHAIETKNSPVVLKELKALFGKYNLDNYHYHYFIIILLLFLLFKIQKFLTLQFKI